MAPKRPLRKAVHQGGGPEQRRTKRPRRCKRQRLEAPEHDSGHDSHGEEPPYRVDTAPLDVPMADCDIVPATEPSQTSGADGQQDLLSEGTTKLWDSGMNGMDVESLRTSKDTSASDLVCFGVVYLMYLRGSAHGLTLT